MILYVSQNNIRDTFMHAIKLLHNFLKKAGAIKHEKIFKIQYISHSRYELNCFF